jgi:SAM-dependent methyltransferase
MKCKICQSECRLISKDLFDDRYGYPGKFSIYECINCGFALTEPQLKKEQMKELYTNYYPRKNTTVKEVRDAARYKSGILFKIKSWINGWDNTCHYYIKPKSKVLDIGCGNGFSLLEIKSQLGEAYGIEEDRNIEPIARELSLNIFFGSLEQASYPNIYFDYITMSQLLEHIPDPIDFLNLAIKKLSPTGKIIMSFPNKNSIYRKINKSKWINWHIPYHLNFFTNRSIKILAKQLNLKIDKCKTVTPNCWVEMQLRSNLEAHKEGEKSKIWYPINITNKKEVLQASFLHVINYLFIPANRIVDLCMQGDSFLVIMSKK